MGIKTDSHNEIADALTIKLNEIKVDQLMTKFKIDNPNHTQEEYDKKLEELNIEYGIIKK